MFGAKPKGNLSALPDASEPQPGGAVTRKAVAQRRSRAGGLTRLSAEAIRSGPLRWACLGGCEKMGQTMKHNFSLFLISSILLCAATPALVVQGSAEPPPCADRSVTAGAVRTTEDVKSFVQCAYEFVQEAGFEEARRAFHEDERWRNGPTYVFVDEVTPMRLDARAFIFPPDPSLEGQPWGPLVDALRRLLRGTVSRHERRR